MTFPVCRMVAAIAASITISHGAAAAEPTDASVKAILIVSHCLQGFPAAETHDKISALGLKDWKDAPFSEGWSLRMSKKAYGDGQRGLVVFIATAADPQKGVACAVSAAPWPKYERHQSLVERLGEPITLKNGLGWGSGLKA